MEPKYIIFSGAPIDDYDWLARQINPDDHIICADGGAVHAKKLGVVPDYLIGDFDSISSDLLAHYSAISSCQVMHDTDQDTSDLMKALALIDRLTSAGDDALIHVFGASGARPDHVFAHYLILLNHHNPDSIILRSPYADERIITKICDIHGKEGDYVGIFPLRPINDLRFEGLAYPADGLPGPYDFGWNGACNIMTAPRATIHLSNGAALITHSRDNP